MKTLYALSGLVCFLVAHGAVAQSVQVKQRAKELRDQNNVRQEVAPPTQAAPPGAAPTRTAVPSLSPSLVQFQTGLAGIKPGTPLNSAQSKRLSELLLTAAQGNKPSAGLLDKLVADLAAAFAERPLPASSRSRLMVDLDAVLNPAKYPQARPEGIFRDVQAIFQDNGLARSKALAIAEDVRAISVEVQGGGAK